MSSLKQIEANRLNALKSTGPRSVEGKASSSQNALQTGIDAQSIIIRGENIADLETLTAEYVQRFRPRTPEQRHFVDSLIRDDWQLRRLARADAQIWERAMNRAFQLDKSAPLGHVLEITDNHFTRLQRRIDSIHRSYKTALRELERLQAEQLPDQSRDREGAADSPDIVLPPSQTAENTSDTPQIGLVPSPPPSLHPGPLPTNEKQPDTDLILPNEEPPHPPQ